MTLNPEKEEEKMDIDEEEADNEKKRLLICNDVKNTPGKTSAKK